MSFNVINLKNRDESDVWLQLVGADGEPMVYGKDEKPVRIKMKSPHNEAFKRAVTSRKIKDQIIAQNIVKEAQAELKDGQEFDLNKFIDSSVDKVVDGIDSGAKMICSLVTAWDGFIDENNKPIEYKPEYLFAALTEPENLATYTAIIKSIETKQGFFTE